MHTNPASPDAVLMVTAVEEEVLLRSAPGKDHNAVITLKGLHKARSLS